MAKIYVNGDVQEVNLPLNVSELIKLLLVENPEMVSVQVNEEFADTMRGLQSDFSQLNGEALALQAEIEQNLKELFGEG